MESMVDTKEYIQETLRAQRCFILSLQHQNLNPMQLRTLTDIFEMNQQLAYVTGSEVPEMEDLLKNVSEIVELEALYGNG